MSVLAGVSIGSAALAPDAQISSRVLERGAHHKVIEQTVQTTNSAGQGTFQNLDFEAAQLVFVDSPTNRFIATEDALPGWAAFAGDNALSTVHYRVGGFIPLLALSDATEVIMGGVFSVFLNVNSSISQTGLIPDDAMSLLFSVANFGRPRVMVAGTELPYIAISTGPDYTVFGADISAFAGHTETLSFRHGGNSFSFYLDDIQFSSEPIPEPAVLALIFLGGGVLLCRRRAS